MKPIETGKTKASKGNNRNQMLKMRVKKRSDIKYEDSSFSLFICKKEIYRAILTARVSRITVTFT